MCFVILSPFLLKAQNIDSLKAELKNALHDSVRCEILMILTESTPDGEWELYNKQIKTISQKNLALKNGNELLFLKYYAFAENNNGFIYDTEGNLTKALASYNKSLKINTLLGDKNGMATTLINIGFIYSNQGDITNALDCFGRSLKLQEEMGDKKGIAISLNNIAFVYDSQGDIATELEYFEKSLKIREEIGDKYGIANSLNNIAHIYEGRNEKEKALDLYTRSLKIREEVGDKEGIAISLNNIGSICLDKGEITLALSYFERGLKSYQEIEDKKGISLAFVNIGGIYFSQKNYKKALELTQQAILIGKELGYPKTIQVAARQLNLIYKATGNYKAALESYELFIQMRDTLSNEATRKSSVKKQFQIEYERKAIADSVRTLAEKNAAAIKLEATEAKLKQEKTQRVALYGGLGLVIVFAGFMYNRFKVTQRQKNVIEMKEEETQLQKLLVEEKQKAILDSIHYAKRIQRALLANETYVTKTLNRLKKK